MWSLLQLLMTNFGLVVKFRGSSVSITIHGRYSAQMSGICGNCDNNKENDCKGYVSTGTSNVHDVTVVISLACK